MVCPTSKLVRQWSRFTGCVGSSASRGSGFLSLIPHLIKHCAGGCRWGVGVAGWNTSAACSEWVLCCGGAGLGTLLGPEETPACGGVFFLAAPGSVL